jgi:hypothetical protein
MNPEKSKYSPRPAAKSVNLTIEADENHIKINAEGVDGNGNPTHVQYDAKFDGKDFPATGLSAGNTVSVKRINAGTIQATMKGRQGDDDGDVGGLQRRQDAHLHLQRQGCARTRCK